MGVDVPAVLAGLHRPSTGTLTMVAILTVLAWLAHIGLELITRPDTPPPGAPLRPPPLAHSDGRLEPPAVVGLLTNALRTPNTAITATALDLAARGWIQLGASGGELVVVTRPRAAAGDSLRPFEQQVLNHLSARAFNGVASAGTLSASRTRIDRRWRLRFDRSVTETAGELGLVTRRYAVWQHLIVPAIAAVALVVLWRGTRDGDQIALVDSWQSRLFGAALTAALLAVCAQAVARAVAPHSTPTDLGEDRTADWLGYRQRLVERIPPTATVIATPSQQQALSHAVVMGVAAQVMGQLPIVDEDPRHAWSEAGGIPHVVTVRYPYVPGYGQHPGRLAAVGIALGIGARWLQSWLLAVAAGESLSGLRDRLPGQIDLVETIAEVGAALCWLPLAWSAWAVVAGIVDSIAARERSGSVVRARRPVEVVPGRVLSVVRPLAERDRFSTYLAVDDGRRRTITAWLADERTAAPQGSQAQVRATPLLGHVRESEPVGTGTRVDA